MQKRHVLVLTRRGVPPEQVIVVGADLARGMMMPDIVVIDLGERNPNDAENQEDLEQPQAGTGNWPPQVHVRTPSKKGRQRDVKPEYYGLLAGPGQADG